MRAFSQSKDLVEEYACPKTYHVNIVFVLRAHGDPTPVAVERVRVVLDKTGIRQLKEV